VTGSPTSRPRETLIVNGGAWSTGVGMIARRRPSAGSSASGRSESASLSTAVCTAAGTATSGAAEATVFSPRLKAQ
jgi:hypothetical protein